MKRFAHPLGAVLVLLTGMGHTVGQFTANPAVGERVVRDAMANVYPMAIAANRSMLDFYVGESWLVGLVYFALGVLLLVGERSRKTATIGAVTAAVSAVIAFCTLPLPPALFLALGTVAFLIAAMTEREVS